MSFPVQRVSERSRQQLPGVQLDRSTATVITPTAAASGTITEWAVQDQFDERFDYLVGGSANAGPRAFCGAACIAIAQAARQAVQQQRSLTRTPVIADVISAVTLIAPFEQKVNALLRRLQRHRQAYCDATPQLRDLNSRARRQYMNSWMANFEVSMLASEEEGLGGAVIFLRANQNPMLRQATFEEAMWIEIEESRFGGVERSGCPCYDGETDRAVLVDVLTTAGPSTLVSVDAFVMDRNGFGEPPYIVIVDQQGHFAAQLFEIAADGTPSTHVLNSLATRDASDPVPAMVIIAHDLCCAMHRRQRQRGASAEDPIQVD